MNEVRNVPFHPPIARTHTLSPIQTLIWPCRPEGRLDACVPRSVCSGKRLDFYFFLKGRCVLFAFDVRRFEISEIRYCIVATLVRFPNICGWIWGLKSVALFCLIWLCPNLPCFLSLQGRKKKIAFIRAGDSGRERKRRRRRSRCRLLLQHKGFPLLLPRLVLDHLVDHHLNVCSPRPHSSSWRNQSGCLACLKPYIGQFSCFFFPLSPIKCL